MRLRSILLGVPTYPAVLTWTLHTQGKAPVITVFDHRGCTAHTNKEYTGGKSGDQDDEMCVKVST